MHFHLIISLLIRWSLQNAGIGFSASVEGSIIEISQRLHVLTPLPVDYNADGIPSNCSALVYDIRSCLYPLNNYTKKKTDLAIYGRVTYTALCRNFANCLSCTQDILQVSNVSIEKCNEYLIWEKSVIQIYERICTISASVYKKYKKCAAEIVDEQWACEVSFNRLTFYSLSGTDMSVDCSLYQDFVDCKWEVFNTSCSGVLEFQKDLDILSLTPFTHKDSCTIERDSNRCTTKQLHECKSIANVSESNRLSNFHMTRQQLAAFCSQNEDVQQCIALHGLSGCDEMFDLRVQATTKICNDWNQEFVENVDCISKSLTLHTCGEIHFCSALPEEISCRVNIISDACGCAAGQFFVNVMLIYDIPRAELLGICGVLEPVGTVQIPEICFTTVEATSYINVTQPFETNNGRQQYNGRLFVFLPFFLLIFSLIKK